MATPIARKELIIECPALKFLPMAICDSAVCKCMCRLMELDLLRPPTVITWLASPERLQLGPAPQEGSAADSWALLGAVLREVFARHQGARETQARMAAAVTKAENLLALASEEVAAATAEEQDRAAVDEADIANAAAAGRQRIPMPGARGPVSRLQMATMREEAATRKVTAAQQEVARQGELLQRLEAERAEALSKVRLPAAALSSSRWVGCDMSFRW
jgi:hypothetical protein